jgi:hypothetical protein
VILGARGWAHFEGEDWDDWRDFKRAVNKEFALSKSQLNARFYAMRPRPGDSPAAFVVRVERERKALRANSEATLHCFLPHLGAEMNGHLDNLRRTKAAMDSDGDATLQWKEVVALARHELTRQPSGRAQSAGAAVGETG